MDDQGFIRMQRKKIAILSSYFRLGQWRGIMRYGQQAGWICQRIDRDTLARLKNWKPDGILYQIDEYDTPLLGYVGKSVLPKVGLRSMPSKHSGSPLVLCDLAAIGHKIASHFVVRNYRRLAYLGPKTDDAANAGTTHALGMRQVAKAHGIPLECYYPDDEQTWKTLGLRYRKNSSSDWDRFWEMGPALIDHLQKNPEPVAVFSAFSEPAMEFIEMIAERKLQIPSQIGIAAQTEDALNGEVTMVPMTCIVPDYELQGFEAARLLDQMLNGNNVAKDHRHFVSKFELVLRESSNQIVSNDPLLVKMLEHVSKNAKQASYTPQKLASQFGCSLRLIQIRFRKSLNRGVAEIIREHRTSHAVELISKTNLPLKSIYMQCGFSGHHQLERAIRAQHGVVPSALRANRSEKPAAHEAPPKPKAAPRKTSKRK